MAFKTIKIKKDDLEFAYKVNINNEGVFTTYLPEDIVTLFENAGIELKTNPSRRGRRGFFSAEKMKDVTGQVSEVIGEYFSRELIEEKMIIKYDIQTTCSYCLNDDGTIVPNGNWVDSGNYKWKEGTVNSSANYPKPYGILVYAKPFMKYVYKYKSGKKKVEVDRLTNHDIDKDTHPFTYHLSEFCSMKPPGASDDEDDNKNLDEIDCTEDTARFFVELLTSICAINERIKDRLDPKSILQIIENKQKLLG